MARVSPSLPSTLTNKQQANKQQAASSKQQAARLNPSAPRPLRFSSSPPFSCRHPRYGSHFSLRYHTIPFSHRPQGCARPSPSPSPSPSPLPSVFCGVLPCSFFGSESRSLRSAPCAPRPQPAPSSWARGRSERGRAHAEREKEGGTEGRLETAREEGREGGRGKEPRKGLTEAPRGLHDTVHLHRRVDVACPHRPHPAHVTPFPARVTPSPARVTSSPARVKP